jgi:hypothetical protein
MGPEVNAEKTDSVFMSGELNAEQYYDTKIANKSFESVEGVKYMGTT